MTPEKCAINNQYLEDGCSIILLITRHLRKRLKTQQLCGTIIDKFSRVESFKLCY